MIVRNSDKKSNISWLILFVFLFSVVWLNSMLGTTNIVNWFIENTLTVISLLFLISTFRRYRFQTFSYLLIFIFLCLHVYGSKYTYSENPFGFYAQDIFNSPRNQYDRLVHFSFGFLLYYPMWECFSNWLKYPQRLAFFLPVLSTLSIGAIYEIIEWLVADIFFVAEGISYLGTQGDVWDAQKDMGIAFVGACIAALLFYLLSLFKNKALKSII